MTATGGEIASRVPPVHGLPDPLRAHPGFDSTVFLLERRGERGFASALRDGHRWALVQGVLAVVSQP